MSILGGICYWLNDKAHTGLVDFYTVNKNTSTFIQRELFVDDSQMIYEDAKNIELIQQIKSKNFVSLNTITKGRNAFGIVGKESEVEKVSTQEKNTTNTCELRCMKDTIRYINENAVTKNIALFKYKYKIFVSKSALPPNKDNKVIRMPYIAYPMQACTDTFIPIGEFNTFQEAENLKKYMQTKFLRYMVNILKVSQNVSQNVYQLVPLQNFTQESDIDWSQTISQIDEQLFNKYELTQEQRERILSTIKALE